jgi:hypothetical protein
MVRLTLRMFCKKPCLLFTDAKYRGKSLPDDALKQFVSVGGIPEIEHESGLNTLCRIIGAPAWAQNLTFVFVLTQ